LNINRTLFALHGVIQNFDGAFEVLLAVEEVLASLAFGFCFSNLFI